MTAQKKLTDYISNDNAASREEDLIALPFVVKELPLSRIREGATYTFSKTKSKQKNNPLHSIHPYPAKFIPEIPRWAIKFASIQQNASVLDPFAGSGTTLLESILLNRSSIGIEIHPLGRLITKAKTTPLSLSASDVSALLRKLFRSIRNDNRPIALDDEGQQDINLHSNWRYWFDDGKMQDLIRIKRNILSIFSENYPDLRDFLLVCLSSVIKPVSYLSERQIKVRRDPRKMDHGTPNPIMLFRSVANKRTQDLLQFSKTVGKDHSHAELLGADARRIELDSDSLDLVVTSPPYLNAIDYPFAHKYELFILDLVLPENYRPHSRSYIGVSERVLLKQTYDKRKNLGYNKIDSLIDKIYSMGQNEDKKRAYIMYQYFKGMKDALSEMHRTLKDNKLLIIVVGEGNQLRGVDIPTASLVEDIAIEVGFEKELHFFHRLHSRKLSPKRNSTGGLVRDERISVLRKA